jgi:hypothetical protein
MLMTLAMGWHAFPRVLYRRIHQPVQFSHRIHTGEKVGLSCDSCHTLSDDGRFAGIPAIEQCSGCHAQAQGLTADEKEVVEKYVTPNKEIPWLVYARQPENVNFSHAPHLKLAQLKCERCHGPHGSSDSLRPYEENRISTYSRDIWGHSISRMRNNSWEGMKMDDCARCHQEQNVSTSCIDCHK